jgi:hypothetical protein
LSPSTGRLTLLYTKISNFLPFYCLLFIRQIKFRLKKFTNKGEIIMKKFLTLALLLSSAVMFVPGTEAKAAEKTSATALEANALPQIYTQRRNRRGARIVTRTRIVRSGFRTYREVVQYRYRPNGSVTVRVLSRIRIR